MQTDALDVLVVDDDDFVLSAVAQVLELEGHLATTARDAAEALEIISATPPDVLITDLKLGGTDGCVLVGQARAVVPGLPAVIMTGHPNARAEVRGCGAIHLAKPFGLDELIESIQRALSGTAAGTG